MHNHYFAFLERTRNWICQKLFFHFFRYHVECGMSTVMRCALLDICTILSWERLFKTTKKHFISHNMSLFIACRSPRVTHQHRRKARRQKATIQPLEALFWQFPNAFAEYLGGAVLFWKSNALSLSAHINIYYIRVGCELHPFQIAHSTKVNNG